MLALLTAMDSRGTATIEVDERAYELWNAVLWSDWTWRLRRRAARFDPVAYELSSASREAVTA